MCIAVLVTAFAPSALAAAEVGRAQPAASMATSHGSEQARSRVEQNRFRHSLGLDASDAALARAAAADNSAAKQFGVPLSNGELAELLRRDRVIRDDVPTIRRTLVQSFGDQTLAGVWMDNLGGGVLTVAVTHSAAAVHDRLASIVRHPADLRVVTRTHSLTELSRISSDLRASASDQNRELAGIRLDERANRLEVLTTDVRLIRRWITDTVGAGAPVDVEFAGVTTVGTQYNNSPPLRGGQAINSSEGYTCTSAFTAHGPGGLYVLTAGHCSTSGWLWDQVGTPIGIADASDVIGTDVLRIPADGLLTNQVTLWYTPTFATEARYQTITSSQSAASDAVGQISCITGQNFADLRCGEIITRSFAVDVPNHDMRRLTYTNGREIDADCNPGDSGGSALRGSQARGIVSVKVTRTWANDTCVYVHIDTAMNQIGVTEVLVSGPQAGT